jgi:peptidyl-tRNA hydrolase, PTH1 family
MHPVFGEIGEIRHNEEVYFLLKPQTYMNLSGQAIVPCLQYYKGDARKDLIVISDDIDMEFGKVRFRSSGSSGGQNGLKSIIEQLGHQDFQRIKIGI